MLIPCDCGCVFEPLQLTDGREVCVNICAICQWREELKARKLQEAIKEARSRLTLKQAQVDAAVSEVNKLLRAHDF